METKHLNQHAVYWEKSNVDRYGKPRLAAGVQLAVRWEERSDELQQAEDTPIAVDAFVVVDQDVAEDSIMWLGKLTELPSDVTTTTDLFKVIKFSKIPDTKGRNFRRVAMLQRYGQTLPTIV